MLIRSRGFAVLALAGLVTCRTTVHGATAEENETVFARQVRAHTAFLADDLLEGRAAGARGHAIAMRYVIAQFERLGIEPAGESGYLQPIALRESRLDIAAGRLVVHRAGVADVTLAPLTDMLARPAMGTAGGEIRAAAVFVGFGISAPEFGYDDFHDGIDVRDRIAVVLAGSPRSLPATARAHYSREKTAELVRRGAVGIVTVETPEEEKRTPWAMNVNRGRFPSMRLVNPDGSLHEAYPELRGSAGVSRAAGAALFAHAPAALEAVFAAAARSEPQAFELGIELTVGGRATIADAASANVLGWLPGTDETLAGEPLVLTAHIDHLGIGPAIDGDTIYNGALDNAIGAAVMLAVTEQLATGPRLRRPVLIAALTGEEKGLLGATYLARHPPARVRRYAANLNLDMPLPLAATRDVIGIGAEHSTWGDTLAVVAAEMGFTVSPDPTPEEVVFVRSDQYPFVRAGVPALFCKIGGRALDPAIELGKAQIEFRRQRYHKPSDDLAQPIDWPSAGALVRLTTGLLQRAANDAEAPAWRPGDFFGTRFAPTEARSGGASH